MYVRKQSRRATGNGTSPDLMPSIMGAIDALLEKQSPDDVPELQPSHHHQNTTTTTTATPKRCYQANNFANLSPNVQKILANVPDQELTKKFSCSEEAITRKSFRNSNCFFSRNAIVYKSQQLQHQHQQREKSKSNEQLDVISTSVQKMLSNLPDSELVTVVKNDSFLHKVATEKDNNNDGSCGGVVNQCGDGGCDVLGVGEGEYPSKPLGSYLHTSPSGIASRMPVGRKNKGKFLQVPSESTNSTASSEVSRPVSLTSLGSCSSSGSSGHHQVGSAYLASAESLDSDPEPNGSQGSADSGIADQAEISPEMRVLQEVMDTETVYVEDLEEVIEGYLISWRRDAQGPLAQHLSDLFSNIEEIYRFNRSFLDQLRIAGCDPTQIANVFLRNDSGFSVYTEYCTNYPRTMDVLSELTRDKDISVLFREQQLKLKHPLPLGSYLLKPVQRILKYHLLLQRLSKQCEEKHKPAVDLALATMTGIATNINNMKRKNEDAVRVQEIQSQLYGWTGADLTALGELIAEGTFRVGGARGKRHVFLFDKVLLIAKSRGDGTLAYKNHIDCSNLMLVEQVRGEPLSFHVLPFDNPRLQLTLRAGTPKQKRDWTLQIKRVILENYSAVIPNHARQLVMQLGQEIPDTEDGSEKWPLKQHSTLQYLEKRSRVRKSRDQSSTRRAASQDRSFVSLGSWRRKSEPSMAPPPPQQYNIKTMPKKITNLKKAKETSNATFYTDLSDSESCDIANESNDSIDCGGKIEENGQQEEVKEKGEQIAVNLNTLERVVSELLMQNKDFHKILNRRKNGRGSEPLANIWKKTEAVEEKLPAKADSLPRNIQLNDHIENVEKAQENGEVVTPTTTTTTAAGAGEKVVASEVEEQREGNLSSQLDDSINSDDHPEHRIYRKSAIRFSLLQRFRAIISEEQKRNGKLPTYKQGSKSMGEKIANQDYADPAKLFASSRNPSELNLSTVEVEEEEEEEEFEKLDLTINESDVLREFEKRLEVVDTGQEEGSEGVKSSQSCNCISSSQSAECFYETIMERKLDEEVDSTAKKRVESFSDNNKIVMHNKVPLKRPNKAPPPIPAKPKGLSNIISNATTNDNTNTQKNCNKSWVKTMVGRFE